MVKVSVLVPVYNVEKYLMQCLDSIIGQTLDNIEIICVNDGSTDSSLEILKDYGEKDKRIKIIDKENGGLPSARNAGLDAATGEYVSFIDSDDYIQPDMMERLYRNAQKTKAEIVVCGANIFPETPHADEWVYSVLSPKDKYYETCNKNLLFENPAVRPFIWRVFVKKELIDREQIRLNESIHIGEDNAFQLRLYPKANGISVISDKLYNYRWFREDSLMNTMVYKDGSQKVLQHIKMVLHVAEEWGKSGDMEKMGFDFLCWSVEFLYDDFIRLPLKDRILNGRLLTEMWTKYGYYQYKVRFPGYISDMFKYFYGLAVQKEIEQHVSIVMSADRDYSTLKKSIKSCLEQDYENFELIIVNNTVSGTGYSVLQKYLMKDKRIRLFNFAPCHFTEAYNKVLNLCVGEYVHFIKPNVWYKAKDSLNNWLQKSIKDNADIFFGLGCNVGSAFFSRFGNNISFYENPAEYFIDADLHDALIKTAYILKHGFRFEDYSLESGTVILAKLCMNTKKIGIEQQVFCISERQYAKDWISTEECIKVLKSFAERLKMSIDYNSPSLHKKVFALLSGDYYSNILLNNTLPYWQPDYECPDGSNSQFGVMEQIVNILELLRPDILNEGMEENVITLPVLFRNIVDRRNKFAAELSEEYCRIS